MTEDPDFMVEVFLDTHQRMRTYTGSKPMTQERLDAYRPLLLRNPSTLMSLYERALVHLDQFFGGR